MKITKDELIKYYNDGNYIIYIETALVDIPSDYYTIHEVKELDPNPLADYTSIDGGCWLDDVEDAFYDNKKIFEVKDKDNDRLGYVTLKAGAEFNK